MIHRIAMRNLLSFGPASTSLELGKLSVLIGPNGSGKSNLLEVMGFLSQLPASGPDSSLPIVDWIWKGNPLEVAEVDVLLDRDSRPNSKRVRHQLRFQSLAQRFNVNDELLEDEHKTVPDAVRPFFYFKYEHGKALFSSYDHDEERRTLKREELDPERSVLSQRNDPDLYPELARVASSYKAIRVYRDVSFGPRSPMRMPQRTDLTTRGLLEDGANLGLILKRLQADARARKNLEKLLRKFYEPAEAVDVQLEGGTAQIYLAEGDWSTPATRLSDGTMRWLMLLAVLLDPSPPGLVCFDEPDLGLHPDIIPVLADVLVEASERMQVIVTTHSDELVDAFSDRPDCIVVCEKQDQSTTFRRLDAKDLAIWLDRYSLGELCHRGEIGGRRV